MHYGTEMNVSQFGGIKCAEKKHFLSVLTQCLEKC